MAYTVTEESTSTSTHERSTYAINDANGKRVSTVTVSTDTAQLSQKQALQEVVNSLP